jgi:hypothetical protein
VFAIALLAFRNFLAIYRDVPRRLDADAHLGAVHRHHGYFNVVADSQGLTGSSR